MTDIFDAIMPADDAMQKRRQIVELRNNIARCGTRCGDCSKWMKTTCPKERNVNGYSRGPSCDEPKCEQFMESQSTTEFRAKLIEELKQVEMPRPPSSAPTNS